MTIHEISGSEYALVDADDTPDDQRLITPFVRQIKVVPNGFSIDGNFTNGSNGFTYLSNFEAYPTATDRNVSALLDLNISARSATNAITTNYTALCYAKDGNIGDGWLSGGELLFSLHISPSMVRDILTFQTTFNMFAAHDSTASTDMLLTSRGDYSLSPLYGYDQSLGVPNPFLILRLQIELKKSLSQEAKGIGYSIKHLYM